MEAYKQQTQHQETAMNNETKKAHDKARRELRNALTVYELIMGNDRWVTLTLLWQDAPPRMTYGEFLEALRKLTELGYVKCKREEGKDTLYVTDIDYS